MNVSPQMDYKPQSAVTISTIVVVNIIWWMVLIAAIGLGATHLGRCSVQPYVPIYLIVLGASSILALCLTYTRSIYDDGVGHILSLVCTAFLHIFSFGWFIAGTCWVYAVYPPNYSPGSSPYCDKTTYQFAFVVTTLLWVTLSLMFICGCCFGLLTCCTTVVARGNLIPTRSSFYGAIREEPPAGDV